MTWFEDVWWHWDSMTWTTKIDWFVIKSSVNLSNYLSWLRKSPVSFSHQLEDDADNRNRLVPPRVHQDIQLSLSNILSLYLWFIAITPSTNTLHDPNSSSANFIHPILPDDVGYLATRWGSKFHSIFTVHNENCSSNSHAHLLFCFMSWTWFDVLPGTTWFSWWKYFLR